MNKFSKSKQCGRHVYSVWPFQIFILITWFRNALCVQMWRSVRCKSFFLVLRARHGATDFQMNALEQQILYKWLMKTTNLLVLFEIVTFLKVWTCFGSQTFGIFFAMEMCWFRNPDEIKVWHNLSFWTFEVFEMFFFKFWSFWDFFFEFRSFYVFEILAFMKTFMILAFMLAFMLAFILAFMLAFMITKQPR